MIIIKPEWVSHAERTQDNRNKKPCIYSVHVSPDGSRLATGSLDGHVKIWNTVPIFNEEAERDPNCHKLLCTMTMHNGAVLCVRWSNGEGRYLASSSDNDNVIIIWERDRNAAAGSVFGSSDVNYETWRAVKYLRGHESDVQDLAWSKDNQYLASCGVDGFIIVWDGTTFEQVQKIDQHSGFVKGVTWDPAGKFLASQSDDKMVKIWRTSDWGLETDIVNPFINAPGTTLFRRLSWSPDGAHVAAANAVNGLQCIAAIINRDDWNDDVSLVGHQLPVEVTSFNPKMFYMKSDEPDDHEKSLATICALGSQDRSVSIWVTKFSRPVCVAADIFDNNVYDLAWTPDGKSLFACSQDGTVACLQLDSELEDIAPDEEIYKELAKYGYGRKQTQLPETPAQLRLEEENAILSKANSSKRISELITGNTSIEISNNSNLSNNNTDTLMTEATETNKNIQSNKITLNSSMTSSSSTMSTVLEQKVSIAKNGKKRIQPVMLSPSTSSSTTTSNLSSSINNYSKSVYNTTDTSNSQCNNNNPNTNNRAQSSNSQIQYDEPISIPPTGISTLVTGNKRKVSQDSDDKKQDSELIGNKSHQKPKWVESAVAPPNIQKSQVKMGLPKVISILSIKPDPSEPATVVECHNKSSTHVKTKLIASKQGIPIWMDYLPSSVMLMTSNSVFTSVSCEDGSIHIYSPAGRHLLPPMIMESTPVILQSSQQFLLCVTATGLCYSWDIAKLKNTLPGVSIAPILQVAELSDDTTHKAAAIRDVKLSKNGLPILITSLQQAFYYHMDMKVWLRVSDAWYIISEFWGSGLQPSSNNTKEHQHQQENPLGWLSSKMNMGGGVDQTTKLLLDLAQTDSTTTAVITISHIETQLAVAALLESANEYIDWLVYYARRLSEENEKGKVEELCQWLMGPPFVNSEFVQWEPTIMGTLVKKDLLKQILPVLAQNRQLQRTVTEFNSFIS